MAISMAPAELPARMERRGVGCVMGFSWWVGW